MTSESGLIALVRETLQLAELARERRASLSNLLVSTLLVLARVSDARKYFLKKHAYTINHKRIAINYLYFSMWTGLSGAVLATMIRLEMAYPGSPFFKGDSIRYLQVISAHGLIMVFFVVVPIVFGGFANFLLPYHVGSKDVAFPRLNSIGFWIQPLGFILVAKIAFLRPQYWHYYDRTSFFLPTMEKDKFSGQYSASLEDALPRLKLLPSAEPSSFFSWRARKKISIGEYESSAFNPLKLLVPSDNAAYPESLWYLADKVSDARRRKVYFSKCSNRTLTAAGWTFITPMSSSTKYTGFGAQDILVVSVVLAGVSTTISFTNLLITRRTLVSPGLRNRRVLIPFVTIATLLTLRMLAIVTPVLGAAVIMILLDRHWQTSFFDFAYGGDPILFQHLFWFFGHPEVYILIIPTFGFVNIILPLNATRRMASKHHMIWAIYVMAYMGYAVWGHHMYLVGLDHRSRNMYSTITIMISLPATIKLVNWTLTLVNCAIKVELCLLFVISYIFFFLTGGFTGMWLSHVGLNVSMHDSFYVVAHFHIMLAGAAVTGCFAGIYYYFYPIFGAGFSKIFGHVHLAYYSAGIWFTFLPMFYLGFSGLPRRIHDFPAVFLGWQGAATCGHFLTLVGIVFFFLAVLESFFENTVFTSIALGLPRWQKRLHYYLFKLKYNKGIDLVFSAVPSAKSRLHLLDNSFNEYEHYRTN